METQGKSNAKPRNNSTETETFDDGQPGGGSSNVAPTYIEPEPFSENDPYRATRIAATDRENRAFLSTIHVEPTGLEELTDAQIRKLHADVEERSQWSKTRQNGFKGLIRLGNRTPSRNERVL